MLRGLGRFLDRFLPADLPYVADRSALHRGRAMAAILLITFANGVLGSLALLIYIALDSGRWPVALSLVAITLQAAFGFSLWLLKRFAAIRTAAWLCATIITASLTALIAYTGGFHESPLTLLLFVQPFVLFIVLGRREALLLTVGIIAIGLMLENIGPDQPSLIPPEMETLLRRTWTGAILAVFACFWYLDHVNRRLTAAIAHERDLAQFAAGHDGLTGLLNRASFEQRLDVGMEKADLQNIPLTLLLVDLDGFKAVNDSFGHQAGDYLLETLAGRLREAVRQNDTVARLGGDEFALILEGSIQRTALDRVIAKLLAALAEPVDYDGRVLQVSGSVGIARCPFDSYDRQTLMRHADIALYRAKSEGKNVAVWFDARRHEVN